LIAMTGITVRMDIKKSGLKNAWIIWKQDACSFRTVASLSVYNVMCFTLCKQTCYVYHELRWEAFWVIAHRLRRCDGNITHSSGGWKTTTTLHHGSWVVSKSSLSARETIHGKPGSSISKSYHVVDWKVRINHWNEYNWNATFR
jgi:hypothetical protein